MTCDPGQTELRDLVAEDDTDYEPDARIFPGGPTDSTDGPIIIDEPSDPDSAYDLLRERHW